MQRGAALMAGMAIGLLANRVFYAPWPLFHRGGECRRFADAFFTKLPRSRCYATHVSSELTAPQGPGALGPQGPSEDHTELGGQKFHDTTACPRPPVTPVDCILDLATKFYEYFMCEDLHDPKYEGYYSLNVDLCFSL